jgi:hypothetical protein
MPNPNFTGSLCVLVVLQSLHSPKRDANAGIGLLALEAIATGNWESDERDIRDKN